MTVPELLGAPGSVVQDIYEGGKAITKGEFSRGVERIMPGAIRGGMQAIREAREGVTSTKNVPKLHRGKKMAPTIEDTILKGLTFNPADMAKAKEQKWADQKLVTKYQGIRSDIYSRMRGYYMEPPESRSVDEYAAIIEEIREYNETIRRNRLQSIQGINFITKESIKRALRQKR
jgi:hypothetical protein